MNPVHNLVIEGLFPKRKICFIVNPKAGVRLQKRIAESVELWLDHNRFHSKIVFTERPGHATELAREASLDGFEIVCAVGGDGSINEVAAGIAGTNAVLGIVPAGSGNGLAMHLGWGRSIDRAIQKIKSAEIRQIDIGLMNGRPFVNVAGIGFDGLVSNLMKKQTKRGLVTYFLKSVEAGISYKPARVELLLDGRKIEETCFTVAIANGPMYGYNFQIAPDAKLDDGLFSVVLLKGAPKWKYFAAVPEMLTERIYEADFVDHFSAANVEIRSDSEKNFAHLDGEGIEVDGFLKFEIMPKALNVLVPKE